MLACTRWALLLASNGAAALGSAASRGFSAQEKAALAMQADSLAALPIVSLYTPSALASLLPAFAKIQAGREDSFAVLRFGAHAALLLEGQYAGGFSGRLETAVAGFGFRVDEALARSARRRRFSGCSGASLETALVERMSAASASFVVLMAFDASGFLKAWAERYGAEPERVLSDLATIADSILSDTGGSCLSGDRYLLSMMLTNTPPDPELVSAQLTRSIARAVGAIDGRDLKLARFLVLSATEANHSAALKAFLDPLSPKG